MQVTPPVLRWAAYEADKTHARAVAPDHAYYTPVKDRKNGKRATLSEARKIVRQAEAHTNGLPVGCAISGSRLL
jgi:hypothetical protein